MLGSPTSTMPTIILEDLFFLCVLRLTKPFSIESLANIIEEVRIVNLVAIDIESSPKLLQIKKCTNKCVKKMHKANAQKRRHRGTKKCPKEHNSCKKACKKQEKQKS